MRSFLFTEHARRDSPRGQLFRYKRRFLAVIQQSHPAATQTIHETFLQIGHHSSADLNIPSAADVL